MEMKMKEVVDEKRRNDRNDDSHNVPPGNSIDTDRSILLIEPLLLLLLG